MSKLIKLTDEAGALLESFAKQDSTSLAGEVKFLLDIRAGKGVSDSISERLDHMAVYLEKRFNYLESLLTDTVVERVDAKTPQPALLPWTDCIQDIYQDFPATSSIWLPGVYESWGNSDSMDMASYFIKGDEIWSEFFGAKTPLMKLTPELVKYLHEKGFPV